MHSNLPGRPLALQTCLIALALSLIGFRTATAQPEQDKFFFLTFRLKAGVVTLVKSQVMPGTLKPQRDSTRAVALRFVLEKAEDQPLWSRRVDDPSVQRLEYEDPDHPGEIRSKVVQLDDVEFIVRAPYRKEVRHVAIYREELSPPVAGEKAAPPRKQLLVRIPLPQEESK